MSRSIVSVKRIRSWSGNGQRYSERAFADMTTMDSISEMMATSPRKCLKCGLHTEGAVMRTRGGIELFPACIACRDDVSKIMKSVPIETSPSPILRCSQCKTKLPKEGDDSYGELAACSQCHRLSFCSLDCKHARFAQTARQGCIYCRKMCSSSSSGEIKV